MASPARQTANAANSALSTGPRTEEGKARSSQNARKHGLTAAQFVIAAEDREEFEEFCADLEADVSPHGPLQQILFGQLTESAWNLRRIRLMEAELTAPAKTYLEILNNPALTSQLDRLARHKVRIERSFYRALRELKALQTDAVLNTTLPAAIKDANQPLASKTQIAKRTQTLVLSDRANGVGEFWSGADAEAAAIQFAQECHQRPLAAAQRSGATT